ncbi:MAG: translation initiation factor IF-2 [Elusimicrobiales bacterium]|nr:translation initiation factor IF-2 [Elusimicrobiales bacterium]
MTTAKPSKPKKPAKKSTDTAAESAAKTPAGAGAEDQKKRTVRKKAAAGKTPAVEKGASAKPAHKAAAPRQKKNLKEAAPSAEHKPAAKPAAAPHPAPAKPVAHPAPAKPAVHPAQVAHPVPAKPAAVQPAAHPHTVPVRPAVAPAPVAAKPQPAPAAVPAQPAKPAAVAPAVPAAKPAAAQAAAAPQPVKPAPVPSASVPAAKPAAAPVAAAPAVPAKPKPVIKITGQPTVRELAEKMNIKINDFIKKLMTMGVYATINQRLEPELAELVAGELGFQLEAAPMFAEQELKVETKEAEKPENLKPRPPVVTIMGHVDHGKTSLLDAIRKSNLCSLESGAITQHIGAYKVCHPKGDIVFLDTPGHEAFTAMRSRGAQVTDIVILVVSAVDGVMPQTIEAMDHAKAAGAPIIVAVNKIDLPGANPAKIRQDLSNHGLLPEEWQGKTIYVDISAKKNLNIDKLLDMILLQAELLDLKANPNRPGVATVLEAKRDPKRGVVATILVKTGTVRVGDPFIAGSGYGKVRALVDENGARIESAGPSMPAEVLGFNGEPPHVGDVVHVVAANEARQIAEQRQRAAREASIAHQKHVTLLGLHSQLASKKLKTLQVILKADVQGSIQAIRDSLERLGNDEVEIKIIHSGAGNVNESDILLAKASDAIVLAFRVQVEPNAQSEADRVGIEIRGYDIIYSLFDEVKAAMEGLLEPDIIEVPLGKAEVKQMFRLSSGIIAGSQVLDGKVTRGCDARVVRGKEIVLRGKITGLKRFKDDVKEVDKGVECGILIEGYKDIRPGDVIEAVEKKTVLRRMEDKK